MCSVELKHQIGLQVYMGAIYKFKLIFSIPIEVIPGQNKDCVKFHLDRVISIEIDGLAYIASDSDSKMIGIMNNKPISTLLINAQGHIYMTLGNLLKTAMAPRASRSPIA